MPSWILDTHLRVLFRQLTRRIPENEQKYHCLAASADRLRQARDEKISPSRGQQLVADFVVSVGGSSTKQLTGTAHLLVSAVADEKLGVKNAVSSLETWLLDLPQLRKLVVLRKQLTHKDCKLLDSESFARRWTNAVETIVASARRD